jgi:hypothetical protein
LPSLSQQASTPDFALTFGLDLGELELHDSWQSPAAQPLAHDVRLVSCRFWQWIWLILFRIVWFQFAKQFPKRQLWENARAKPVQVSRAFDKSRNGGHERHHQNRKNEGSYLPIQLAPRKPSVSGASERHSNETELKELQHTRRLDRSKQST